MLNEDIIIEAIHKLSPNSAAGPDCVPSSLLVNCATELVPVLWLIFSHSLSHGVIPKSWKRAAIIPIDVHPNPGPSRYPCSVCFKNVTSQGTSYRCTRCSHWVHSRCSGLRNAADYRKANGWICTACMTPPRPRAPTPPTRPPCQTSRSTYYSGTPMV